MTTINNVGNGLSGVTGTGNFVGSSSPTLVTPTLGAASATSINFGGSSLANYIDPTTWTPVFSFVTPGNLSVSYATQIGYYIRIGNSVSASFLLTATPTFTTSSGVFIITGLPFPSNVNCSFFGSMINASVTSPSYNAGTTTMVPITGGGISQLSFYCCGSAVGGGSVTTTNFTSGTSVTLQGSITYLL